MPGVKKKPSMESLHVSMDNHNRSFSLSDTGSFSQDNFTVGPNGITQSPLSHGEISTLRLEHLMRGGIIGRGNSSRVYHAVHTPSGKRLAVKVLQADLEDSHEARQMLLNEIKIVFNVSSDHLVTFYDAFYLDGNIHLALEYMDCGSLEGLIKAAAASAEGGRLPENVNASITFQILQGLTYLHRERRAVHRDLKPANVLLDSAGFVKLSDFGISKELGTGTLAQAGTQVGTLAYMSPERVRGEPYDFASDVWSLGLIALEAGLGRYPYPAASMANYFDLIQTIVTGPVPTEDPAVQQQLPEDLLHLIHASLNKAPRQRPDVISLLRFPFIARHAQQPVDLRAYLLAVQPALSAAKPTSSSSAGGAPSFQPFGQAPSLRASLEHGVDTQMGSAEF